MLFFESVSKGGEADFHAEGSHDITVLWNGLKTDTALTVVDFEVGRDG